MRFAAVLSVLLVVTARPALAQSYSRDVDPKAFTKFKILGFSQTQRRESGKPDNVIRSFRLDFENSSEEEVDQIYLMFKVERDGKVVYSTGPFLVTNFVMPAISHVGAAAPGLRSTTLKDVNVDYPAEFWTTDARDSFEIVSMKVWEGKLGHHDSRHFYTWLRNAPESEVLREIYPNAFSWKNGFGLTPLALGYAAGTVAEIKAIGESDPLNMYKWAQKFEPLHLAATNDRHLEVMDYALSQSSGVDCRNVNGTTPLMYAVRYGKLANAKWLVDHGANPNALDNDLAPVFVYAMAVDPGKSLDFLAKSGARMTLKDAKGRSLMHWIASRFWTNETLLNQALGYGVAIDGKDGEGATPLMGAAQARNAAAARWLIAHGARVDARDKLGRDVFSYARDGDPLSSEDFFRKEVLAKVKLTKENGVVPKGQDGP